MRVNLREGEGENENGALTKGLAKLLFLYTRLKTLNELFSNKQEKLRLVQNVCRIDQEKRKVRLSLFWSFAACHSRSLVQLEVGLRIA
jgi:hypothetical protein